MYDVARRFEQEGNRLSASHRDLYAGHRARVTATLLAAAPPAAGSLCLFGAGNALDTDLPALLARYARVALVDIDDEALGRAVAPLPEEARARVTRHAPVDLAGIFEAIEPAPAPPPTHTTLAPLVAPAVARIAGAVGGPFDVVASLCVMTQISWAVVRAVPPGLSQDGVREAAFRVHLGAMLALLRPGGQGFLINDLISSEYHPLDELPPDTDLLALFHELVRTENFYRGSNPNLVLRLLRRDDALKGQASSPRIADAWLWRGKPDRTYLVYALSFGRT